MIAVQAVFIQYLLLPLLALLLVGWMVLVKKKNAALSHKKWMVYVLLGALVLALPGLGGLVGNAFSPYWYLFAQVFYLAMGVLHVNLLGSLLPPAKERKTLVLPELLITLLCLVLGGWLFTLVFAWLSPFEGYAWASASSVLAFPVPLVFYYCWLQFTAIPLDIYKVWTYDSYRETPDFEGLDFDQLMVVSVEFTKQPEHGERFAVKAKAPADIALGDWFQRFIEDYNLKYTQSPVVVFDAEGEAYAWIFYTKPSFLYRRRYLDFDATMAANRVNEQVNIICKRVIAREEERTVNRRNTALPRIFG
jgi:hypothetical protein